MDVGIMQFPPGDSRMIDKIVHQLKSQGIFDQFRKECIADVDTKPAYQNLHQRVESTVSGFLASQVWRPDLNKNQLRDSLRKHIHESGFLDIGVERIVDQVVNPKIKTVFMPQVEDVVYSYLGIDRPKKGKENLNVHVAPLTIENLARKEQKKLPTLTDLLPKELEPISPASDTKGIDTSFEEGEVREDNLLSEGKEADDDDEEASPPFEPIAEVNVHDESSVDSHLSGISELTSHGSQHSPVPPAITTTITTTTTTATQLENSPLKVHTLDFTNNDSQLSKVSSGSRLSIVSFSETDNDQSKVLPDAEANEESQQSRLSLHLSSQDTQHSVSMDTYTPTKVGECSQDSRKSPELHLNIKDEDDDSIEYNTVVENLTNIEREFQDQTDGGKIADTPEKELKKETPDEYENIPADRVSETPEENSEVTVKKENGIDDKELNTFMCKSDIKIEIDSYDQENKAKEREPEQNTREMELSIECEKEEEKIVRKTEENMDRKLEFETNKRHEERQEKIQDYMLEKQAEDKQQKGDDKSEKKQEERQDKKSEEKVEKKYEKYDKKLDDKYGKKHDEKSEKKYDNKTESHKDKSDKYDERSEKRGSEKKADDRQEKRYDEKSDKKMDSKSDRKLDDRKSEKSKDSRERSRDKRDEKRKESTGSSKDSKRSESNSHLDGEKKRNDKDKHRKDRSESRNRSEKSNRHDSKESKEKDGKEKQKYDEKNDREGMKGKHKQERDTKEDKRTEEKERKAERESNKEKVKKEDPESSKHEKDSKRKDKEGKERNKGDEKLRSKHDDRHKDRTKSAESKSDKEKSRDDKNSKDGSKSAGKETKDRTKQESKDRGKSDAKDTSVKYDEKKNRDKKYDDKDGRDKSSRSSDKGNSKTPEKKKDDAESSKSSRSEHKHKDSGRKNKDSKSKGTSDDHRIHREKHSEDRRSTDRDSNGTAQDRALGNVSRTNGNDSQRSHSHRTKTNGNNSNSKSDNRGSSESAEMVNEAVKEEIQSPIANSPPSSLPFKKRPYSEETEIKEYQSSISSAGKLVLKTKKKPKIAANIFEVKKIMQLRKSIAKKERKQQKKLRKLKKRKTHDENEVQEVKRLVAPDEVKRVKLGELENSLRKEVKKSLTNKELMPTNTEKEADIKYFASEVDSQWISQKDADFLAMVIRLDKSETLSELSTDTEDEIEEQVQHKVSISYELLEPLVAEELGAKLVRSDGKVHIVFDHAVSLKSHNMDNASPSASEAPIQSDSLKAEGGSVPIIHSEYNGKLYDMSAPVSEQSLEVILESDGRAGHLNKCPSSISSVNSSDSCVVVEESVANKPEQYTEKNTKQRGISTRRTSGKSQDVQEVKPSQDENDKKERRRPLRPSMRYSSKEYASTCMTSDGHLQQGGSEGYEALLNEEAAPETKPIPSVSEQTPSKSKMDNSTTKRVPKKSLAPSGLHKTRAARTLSAFVSDTEDESPVSNNYSFETGYCVIKDNNNVDKDIDKDLSEDEKGNDIPLNQELILSTLQDLMIESGYHKPDIPTNVIHTVRGTNLSSQSHNQESTEAKRPKLGRSRRVGLGKPMRNAGNQPNNDNGGSRTATPPSADFVMPLSPESDVSASSGEAKKGALDSKVTDGALDPSPSNSEGKNDSDVVEGEHRRTLRSSGAQRYTSDDLYKPRPLFTPGSRRSRNRPGSPIEETATSCAMKRSATSMDVADTPPLSKRRR